jgi:hypothetical protein
MNLSSHQTSVAEELTSDRLRNGMPRDRYAVQERDVACRWVPVAKFLDHRCRRRRPRIRSAQRNLVQLCPSALGQPDCSIQTHMVGERGIVNLGECRAVAIAIGMSS